MGIFTGEADSVILQVNSDREVVQLVNNAFQQNFDFITLTLAMRDNTIVCVSPGSRTTVELEKDCPLVSVLDRFPNMRFHFIMHGHEQAFADSLAHLLDEYSMQGKAFVTVSRSAFIRIFRQKNIETTCSWSYFIWFYFLYRTGLLYFKKKSRHSIIIIPETIGKTNFATKLFIAEAAKRGLEIVCTVEQETDVSRLYAVGIRRFIVADIMSGVAIKKKLEKQSQS